MIGFLPSAYEDVQPFSALLPHSLFLDFEQGILLLSTPRFGKPTLALGCAWDITPRNVEVIDEAACIDLARQHESLLRSLPVGAALQVLMMITPATTAPAWEHLRQHAATNASLSPLVDAQVAALRHGLPHQDGPTPNRLRTVRTLLTLRLPVAEIGPRLLVLMQALLDMPSRSGAHLVATLQRHLDHALVTLEGLRTGIALTLQGAGHQHQRLDGHALGQALTRALHPLCDDAPVILSDIPLQEQALQAEAVRLPGGWTIGTGCAALTAQVLSLHRAPPQTYPGILCAPRAPHGVKPFALWEVWTGPLTLVVNVAVVDSESEKARLKFKRVLAGLHGKGSVENTALKKELDTLLEQFFLTGGQLLWGRVHVVLWGEGVALEQGSEAVRQAARRLDLEFLPEPILGSTLFLQTLPLGFDPAWPKENALRRARRLPGANLAHLLPLYGGFQGTATASILYLNQRGEAAGIDPFDNTTNPHMVVMGMSGSGKSFTVAHIVQHVLPLGANVVILDQLPSYQDLCASWDGHYVAMDFNNPICFNPFYGPLDKTHVAFLTASLLEMATGDGERIAQESRGVLADAVGYFAQTWDQSRGEPRLSLFIEEVLGTGSFSPQDKRAHRLAKELCRKLGMFYGRGPYAQFVDGPNTLSLTKALTVIELSQLAEAPDLQAVLFFALMHLLTQFYTDRSRLHIPKYFIADETWSLLHHPATARVMIRIGRTYRKLHTSAIFLSQQAEDFDSPAGRVLRANAITRLFLQQEAEEIELAQGLFKLSNTEKALFAQARKHPGWSSAYLQLPGHAGGLIRLVPDAYTRWVVSQEPQERAMREATVRETGGDMRQALARLAQRYPQGLTGGMHA